MAIYVGTSSRVRALKFLPASALGMLLETQKVVWKKHMQQFQISCLVRHKSHHMKG